MTLEEVREVAASIGKRCAEMYDQIYMEAGMANERVEVGQRRRGDSGIHVIEVLRPTSNADEWYCLCDGDEHRHSEFYLLSRELLPPVDPLAGVDWSKYLPKNCLPENLDAVAQKDDVWAVTDEYGQRFVVRVGWTSEGCGSVETLASNCGKFMGQMTLDARMLGIMKHSRLIARDGKLVGQTAADPLAYRLNAAGEVEFLDKVKQPEPPKAKAPRCKADHCKSAPGVALGYEGRCWSCELEREGSIANRIAWEDEQRRKLTRPERTYYDNMLTAGIGVAGTIWKARG